MKMMNRIAALIAAAAVTLTATACFQKREKFEVNIKNLTGVEIAKIVMTPECDNSNQDNRLKENLPIDGQVTISLGKLTREEIESGFAMIVYSAEDGTYQDFGSLVLETGDTVTFYLDAMGLALGVNMTDEEIIEQRERDNAEILGTTDTE